MNGPETLRTRAVIPAGTGTPIVIAANNGDIGGGEVMLLHLARAMRDLGHEVSVVGPATPGELVSRARSEGFPVTALPGDSRGDYARALRRWDRGRTGLMWCNGLLPATATAGRPDRVVHLHRRPDARQRAARHLAVRGARAVVLPSTYLGGKVPHTDVLANWTDDPGPACPAPRSDGEQSVGFLGRLSLDKGIDVLAESVRRLRAEGRPVRLVLGGESRFGSTAERVRVEDALRPLGDAVTRLGWVERAEFFARVQVAAFPSTWGEPFGLVAAEAMAARMPFVVSDAGALPEVVGPEHPWIAPSGDPDALAGALAAALDDEPGHRHAVLDAARARWETQFSPTAGRERLACLLARLGIDPDRSTAGRPR